MRFPYIMATSILAGLSVANPRPNITQSLPTTLDTVITPIATTTEAPNGPDLSQRGLEDLDFIGDIVSALVSGAEGIVSHVVNKDETKIIISTAPGSLSTITLTGVPSLPISAPATVTVTFTEGPEPTATGPATVTVTNTGQPGTPTGTQQTVTTTAYVLPTPQPPSRSGPGCVFARPDGRIEILPCGPNPLHPPH